MEEQPKSGMFWGLLLIGLGVLFFLDQMNIMDFGELVSTFWPLILVAVGLKMLLRRDQSADAKALAEAESGPGTRVSGERLQETRLFGDVDARVDSQAFGGGNISTLFGDAKIDLSKVQGKEGESIVSVNTLFGDVHVIAPHNTSFAVRANAVLGDIRIRGEKSGGFLVSRNYQPDGYSEAPNRIFLSVSVLFGDIVVE